MKKERSAVGYVRVSTREQALKGLSMQYQRDVIRKYCDLQGIRLLEIVADPGVSASKPLARRTGGKRLEQMIESDRAQIVVGYRLDRLFRDAEDCLYVTGQWDNQGVALHLVDLGGQPVDTTSATGRFFLTIMAAVAEMERNLTRERITAIARHKLECLEPCGGRIPYGWALSSDGKKLVLVDQEIRAVMRMKVLRDAEYSYRKIGKILVKEGYLPRQGEQWAPKIIRGILFAFDRYDHLNKE